MARKSKKTNVTPQRDTSRIANRQVVAAVARPSVQVSPFPRPAIVRSPAVIVDDARTYHPEGKNRPALTVRGTPARFKVAKSVKKNAPKLLKKSDPHVGRDATRASISFQAPQAVSTCVRRGTRREVLAALKKLGSRSGSGKKRRTWRSTTRC